MPVFAANLSMMFTECAFLERFAAAAAQGFSWVEYLFPYAFEPEALAGKLKENGLRQALFNLPAGNWEGGERGMACIPGREKEFAASVDLAVRYAHALGCPRVHAMAGNRPAGVEEKRLQDTYLENIGRAGKRMAEEGLELCLEPINRFSMPDFFLRTQDQAVGVIESLGQANIRLQLDFFHCQMEQGNVANTLRRHFRHIGHCQLAGAPDRHEPDTGELSYPFLFDLLDELGYQGIVGCEYNPAGKTEDGLGWIRGYGVTPRRSM
jgi:hydroxypyruvate isomerase